MRSDTLIQPGEENSTLGSFLNLLWTNMENDEMKLFLKLLLNYLLNTFKEVRVAIFIFFIVVFIIYFYLFCF